MAVMFASDSVECGKRASRESGSAHDFPRMMVNLGSFEASDKGFEIVEHTWNGVVSVEIRDDRLYVGGRRIILGESCFIKSGRSVVRGRDILDEFLERADALPNASIANALVGDQEFIPLDWRKEEPRIVFLGTIFKSPKGFLYALGIRFQNGRWRVGYAKLDEGWSTTMTRVALFE